MMSLCQCNPKGTLNSHLVDGQLGLAVIKAGMAKDGLHRLNIGCCRQHFRGQRTSAAVRGSLFDTGLPAEAADCLLEGTTHTVISVPLAS